MDGNGAVRPDDSVGCGHNKLPTLSVISLTHE